MTEHLDAQLENPEMYARLEFRILTAMANLSAEQRADGQRLIDAGEAANEVRGDVEGDAMVFRWCGIEILRLARGSLAQQEPDA